MLVHGTGHTLEELGLEVLPKNTYLQFKQLNQALKESQKTGALGSLFAWHTVPQLGILDVLSLREGIFGVHCACRQRIVCCSAVSRPGCTSSCLPDSQNPPFTGYHFHEEDITEVDPKYVRNCMYDRGVERVTHFVLINNDTNVIFLDPEVCICTFSHQPDTLKYRFLPVLTCWRRFSSSQKRRRGTRSSSWTG